MTLVSRLNTVKTFIFLLKVDNDLVNLYIIKMSLLQLFHGKLIEQVSVLNKSKHKGLKMSNKKRKRRRRRRVKTKKSKRIMINRKAKSSKYIAEKENPTNQRENRNKRPN